MIFYHSQFRILQGGDVNVKMYIFKEVYSGCTSIFLLAWLFSLQALFKLIILF
jgi:hypothetical protein